MRNARLSAKLLFLLLLGFGIANLIDSRLFRTAQASYTPSTTLTPWLCQPASGSGTAYNCSTNLTLLDGTAISNTAPVKGGTVKTRKWLLAQGVPHFLGDNGIACTGDNWDIVCSLDVSTNTLVKGISTTSNCSSNSSPATCGSAPAGSVAVAPGSSTLVVNTTAVSNNSQVFLMFDASLGSKLGVTCNASEPALYGVTARTGATSFTITSSIPVTNPACFSYLIVN